MQLNPYGGPLPPASQNDDPLAAATLAAYEDEVALSPAHGDIWDRSSARTVPGKYLATKRLLILIATALFPVVFTHHPLKLQKILVG